MDTTGVLGNLTPDEERKLQEAWVHVLRLCGVTTEDSKDGAFVRTPDRTAELSQNAKGYTPEQFRERFWICAQNEHPDGLMLRFLRARKWDVDKSLDMAIGALCWWWDAGIYENIVQKGESVALQKEALTEDETGFLEQYRSGKSYVRGSDKEGRPIYVIKVRLHWPKAQTTQAMDRFVLHNIETIRTMVQAPNDKCCLIFDLSGFGLRNMDFHVVKFLVEVFEARYPETLGVVLIHKAPFVFWGVWRIIKGWLDPVIAAKINFTNSTKDMEQFIAKENLEKCYGGKDDWEYKYVEPIPGENHRLDNAEERDKVQSQRNELTAAYELETIAWAAMDPESDAGKEKLAKRNELAKTLHESFWALDPYRRARTFYHRVGVVSEDGTIDYKAAGKEPIANGNLTTVTSSTSSTTAVQNEKATDDAAASTNGDKPAASTEAPVAEIEKLKINGDATAETEAKSIGTEGVHVENRVPVVA